MRYDPIDPSLFVANRKKLVPLIPKGGLVALHANDIMPTNADAVMPFYQNTDLLYLTGIDQEETVLVLFPDAKHARDREILFVKETSELIAIWDGEKLTKEQAARLSGIERVEWSSSFDDIFRRLVPQSECLVLSTNEHLRAEVAVETRNDRFIRACRERWPLQRLERLAPLMHSLRMLKEDAEIEAIRKACAITEAGFRRVLGFVRPGVGEWEIEAEFQHEFVRRRTRFAYQPIIGSGANACILHYLENQNVCKDGDMVLMDVGAEWARWNSDMTRTIPVNGRFTARQRQVYDAVLRVLRGANQLIRPGVKPTDYQRSVVALMEEELVGLGLFSAKEAAAQTPDKPLVKKYFMHGTSHHLGLDVHDVCPPEEPFAPGMVLTIEPGIYIREEALGVRLENNVLVGTDSNLDLMASIPIEADEIEELMNQGR